MTYRDLDPALSRFCSSHGLHVIAGDRDVEVRAIDVVDDVGSIHQLWIELLADDRIRVVAWDRHSQRATWECGLRGLGAALEAAFAEIASWITAAGHTRTPVH